MSKEKGIAATFMNVDFEFRKLQKTFSFFILSTVLQYQLHLRVCNLHHTLCVKNSGCIAGLKVRELAIFFFETNLLSKLMKSDENKGT